MDWRKNANDEEKTFLHQLTGAMQKAEKQHRCFATGFYARAWMEEVIRKYLGEGVLAHIEFIGGYEDAERHVVLCGYVPYFEEALPIQALQVTVKTGIGKALSHRDFLGALLGLGIDRSKIGDILIQPFGAYVIVVEELVDYISCHLTEVGRYGKVSVSTINFEAMVIGEKQVKEITGTVMSLRTDAVFAVAFGVSRSTVVKLLQQEKGKRNGMLVKSADVLKVGDVCTLRGYGKMKFTAINGTTKKDRLHITVEKYI